MTADEWIGAFAREIGLSPPDREQIGAILKLAGTAAHSSERTAAPVAAWLAGVSGRPLAELNEIAARLGASEPDPAG
jgi:hypothetical protein